MEIKKFQTMPMHLLFLGLEKSLLLKTPIIVNRTVKVQNEFWKGLTGSMQLTQRAVNSISVSWCMSMAFSGKENAIGTLILKRYKEVGVEIKKFQTMPMHLLFLDLRNR